MKTFLFVSILFLSCIMQLNSKVFAQLQPMESLTLNWTDNSNNETGFEIERNVNIGTITTSAFSSLIKLGANIENYIDKTVQRDLLLKMTYCYRLRAFNAEGNSGFSNIACATIDPPKPKTPVFVDIKCSNCSVTVNGVTTTFP